MPTTHTTKNHPATPAPQAKATAKQLRYLKALADQTGQSFTYPTNLSAASTEIRRLKQTTAAGDPTLQRDSAHRERRDISRALTQDAAGATAIRPDETTGYGSSARWA